jgi:polysaccharide export outer membrane protein
MRNPFLNVITIIIVILAGTSVGLHAESFHVGPGDVLEISVWRDENLSREMVITPDGILSFPLVGDIHVANLSVAEIRKVITKRLSEYIPDASVAVMVKQINSLKAYVIGQVNNPGVFEITLETRVMQVLAQAKGLTPFAAERDIHILRYQKGGIQKINFDYKEVLKGNKLEQDILLERGDVIVVP